VGKKKENKKEEGKKKKLKTSSKVLYMNFLLPLLIHTDKIKILINCYLGFFSLYIAIHYFKESSRCLHLENKIHCVSLLVSKYFCLNLC